MTKTMNQLIDLIIAYTHARNISTQDYFDGLFDRMEKQINIDFDKNLEILIRYHKEWLSKTT